MNSEIMEYYASLDFEETEIEDGLTALAFEFSEDESYALLTNEDGAIPENLKQRVVFAYYTSEGVFQWSMGFKNSFVFKDIWSEPQTPQEKLATMQKYRASQEL